MAVTCGEGPWLFDLESRTEDASHTPPPATRLHARPLEGTPPLFSPDLGISLTHILLFKCGFWFVCLIDWKPVLWKGSLLMCWHGAWPCVEAAGSCRGCWERFLPQALPGTDLGNWRGEASSWHPLSLCP